MRGVRGDDDRAVLRLHPKRLPPPSMSANVVKGDAGKQSGIAIVEAHPASTDAEHPHHGVIQFIEMAHTRMTHALPGGEPHLAVLDVKASA